MRMLRLRQGKWPTQDHPVNPGRSRNSKPGGEGFDPDREGFELWPLDFRAHDLGCWSLHSPTKMAFSERPWFNEQKKQTSKWRPASGDRVAGALEWRNLGAVRGFDDAAIWMLEKPGKAEGKCESQRRAPFPFSVPCRNKHNGNSDALPVYLFVL